MSASESQETMEKPGSPLKEESQGQEGAQRPMDLLSPDWVPKMSPSSSVDSISTLNSLSSLDSFHLSSESGSEDKEGERNEEPGSPAEEEGDAQDEGQEGTLRPHLDIMTSDWLPEMSPFSSLTSLSTRSSLSSRKESGSEDKEGEPKEEPGSPAEEEGEDKEETPRPSGDNAEEDLEVCRKKRPPKTPTCLPLRSCFSWVRKMFRRSPPSETPAQSSASSGLLTERKPFGTRIRRWIRQHRGCVHPDPRSMHL